MGRRPFGGYIAAVGVGITLFRSVEQPTRNAIKPDPSTAFDLAAWPVLGALVGAQTQAAFDGGAEAC